MKSRPTTCASPRPLVEIGSLDPLQRASHVRHLAATDRDLEPEVEAVRLRLDRRIDVPPLRDRGWALRSRSQSGPPRVEDDRDVPASTRTLSRDAHPMASPSSVAWTLAFGARRRWGVGHAAP